MKNMHLFDDGRHTYQALEMFPWNGPVAKTPFGDAAYLGTGAPDAPATARMGGWFGVANGRTWAQLFPYRIEGTPEKCGFDINAQDIIAVRADLGGGYVAWGRHDTRSILNGNSIDSAFGTVHQRRLSMSEARYHNPAFESAIPENRRRLIRQDKTNTYSNVGPGTVMTWSFPSKRSWMDEYIGDNNFIYRRETLTGTREELNIPGCELSHLGWSMNNHTDARRFTIERETISDNCGLFAYRNIPSSVSEVA